MPSTLQGVLYQTCRSPADFDIAAHRLDGYATKDLERELDQEPQDLEWQHQNELHLLSFLCPPSELRSGELRARSPPRF